MSQDWECGTMKFTSSPTVNDNLILDVQHDETIPEPQLTDVKSTHDGGHRLVGGPVSRFVRVRAGLLLTGVFVGGAVTPSSLVPTINEVHIAPIQQRAHARALQEVLASTRLTKVKLAELLNISRPTLDAWLQGEPIRDAHHRHLFAVKDVLDRAALQYQTPDQLLAWLDRPVNATGETPSHLLRTGSFDRARLLAMGRPSATVTRVPAWVRRPIAARFHARAEGLPTATPPIRDDELFEQFGEPGGDDEENGEV
jgi:hypothetical protein